jgi:hypothetical protein
MHPDDIHKLLRRLPFRLFRVVLSNNTVHEIRHRDFAALTRFLLKIGFPSGEEEGPELEQEIGVALVHIVQYEFLPPVAAKHASPIG